MGLISVHVFRTLPGKTMQHIAASEEARGLLQGLGLEAATVTPIAGSDVGQIATVVNFADNRSYTDSMQRIQADAGWQAFWARVSSEATAELAEVSLYSDADPTYIAPVDQPAGVLQFTQWRANPGQMGGFLEHVAAAKGHIERLGGSVRVLQCMTGLHPMTAGVSVTFEDLDHFGDYGDKLAADEQFQNYWAGVMTNPTATLVRSGIYAIAV